MSLLRISIHRNEIAAWVLHMLRPVLREFGTWAREHRSELWL